jgi:hypothetical protein
LRLLSTASDREHPGDPGASLFRPRPRVLDRLLAYAKDHSEARERQGTPCTRAACNQLSASNARLPGCFDRWSPRDIESAPIRRVTSTAASSKVIAAYSECSLRLPELGARKDGHNRFTPALPEEYDDLPMEMRERLLHPVPVRAPLLPHDVLILTFEDFPSGQRREMNMKRSDVIRANQRRRE